MVYGMGDLTMVKVITNWNSADFGGKIFKMLNQDSWRTANSGFPKVKDFSAISGLDNGKKIAYRNLRLPLKALQSPDEKLESLYAMR